MTSLAREAYKLFRLVNGPGDSGSQYAFHITPITQKTGWLRLANKIRHIKKGPLDTETHYVMSPTKPAWTAAADAMVKDLMQLPVPTFREIANLAATNGTGEPTVNERCIINLCEGAIRALKSIRTA